MPLLFETGNNRRRHVDGWWGWPMLNIENPLIFGSSSPRSFGLLWLFRLLAEKRNRKPPFRVLLLCSLFSSSPPSIPNQPHSQRKVSLFLLLLLMLIFAPRIIFSPITFRVCSAQTTLKPASFKLAVVVKRWAVFLHDEHAPPKLIIIICPVVGSGYKLEPISIMDEERENNAKNSSRKERKGDKRIEQKKRPQNNKSCNYHILHS